MRRPFVGLICVAILAEACGIGAPTPSGQTQGSPNVKTEPGFSEADADCAAERVAYFSAVQNFDRRLPSLVRSIPDNSSDFQENEREKLSVIKGIEAREVDPFGDRYSQCRRDHEPGLRGMEERAFLAGNAAEKSGNYLEAARQFNLIDVNGDSIMADAITRSQSNNSMDKVNADGMWDSLALATTKLGVYEEKDGDYPAAAQYYQRAIDRMSQVNGVAQTAMLRLAFLYANGRGVPIDDAKARALFESLDGHLDPRILDLMDYGMLPKSPEEVTPALLDELAAKEDEKYKTVADSMRPATCTERCQMKKSDCERSNSLGDAAGIFTSYREEPGDCEAMARSCMAWCH
jgi:tetratricopeptide (TPR) repeat protein